MADAKKANDLRGHRKFETTHWTVIRKAGHIGTPEAREALNTLCDTYRRPVYEFIRGYWKCNEEEAHDLTQGFFTRLIDKNDIAKANEQAGKFRNWLREMASSHCKNEWRSRRRKKRGGRVPPLSIDADEVEEPTHDLTPERIYDREWALTLLEQTLDKLKKRYVQRAQLPLFEKLKLCFIGWDGQNHREMANELGIQRVNTFNVNVNRFKNDFRAQLRDDITQTVSCEEDIEEELRYLLEVLRSPLPARTRRCSMKEPEGV